MTNYGDSRFGPQGGGGFEPRTTPAERRDFFDIRRNLVGAFKEASDKMEWQGEWVSTNNPYDYNDVVRDDDWLMICRTKGGCTQKPAPTPTGPAATLASVPNLNEEASRLSIPPWVITMSIISATSPPI